MPSQSEVMTMTGATAPVYGRYRKQGAQIVPTHPPYIDPATVAPRDGDWRSVPASGLIPSATNASRVDIYGANLLPAWQLSADGYVTAQGVDIPGWWRRINLIAILSRPSAVPTGEIRLSLQHQHSFNGDDFNGALQRTNLPTQGLDMATLAAYQLKHFTLGEVVLPDYRPDSELPFPWWRFRITRLNAGLGDTYGGPVAIHGLAVARVA